MPARLRKQRTELSQREAVLRAAVSNPDLGATALGNANRELRYVVEEKEKLAEQIAALKRTKVHESPVHESEATISSSEDPATLSDIALAEELNSTRLNVLLNREFPDGDPRHAAMGYPIFSGERRIKYARWEARLENLAAEADNRWPAG